MKPPRLDRNLTLPSLYDRLICLVFMAVLSIFLIFLGLSGPFFQVAPVITAPQSGAVLSGRVEIIGDLGVPSFSAADLAFAYGEDTTGTWFLIQTLSGSPSSGSLAIWDTSQLTDGNYRLRLRVLQADGTSAEVIVEDLHIRNDAPTAAPTQPPVLPSESPEPFEEPPEVFLPTSIPRSTPEVLAPRESLPGNPAQLDRGAVLSIFGRSSILVLILFAVLGILLGLRRH